VLNSIRALGNPPVPNFASAGITAGYQLGLVTIAKAVGFKEGVIDLKGPGGPKTDSIPANLSRGESVITAEATARSRNLLEAIQDRRLDDKVLEKLQLSSGGVTLRADNKDLIEEMRKNRQPDYYESGYFVMKVQQKSANLKRHMLGKNFS
jgi:hypothetical protein